MAAEMSDDMSEVGGETEGVPMSSASSISNDFASELPNVMSETEDSNSYLEPSSSETDSYMGTGTKHKDDTSNKSSYSDMTQMSARELGDDGSASGSNVKFPVRPGIIWRKGERLEAEDYQRNWYSSKIININEEDKSVLIHFEGWNQRYDEWVDMSSERLRPLTRHSMRQTDRRRRGKSVYRVGDQVQAKWTDCKMYLAKIDEVMADGSYMVLFYDGIKKNIQPINLRPVPLEQRQQKFQIKPLVLSPKELKSIKNKPVEFKDSTCMTVSDITDKKHAWGSGKKAENLKGKPGSASSGSASTGTGASHCTEKPAKPTGQSMEKPAKPASQASSSQKKSKLIISGSLFSKKDKAAPKEQSPKEQPGGALPKKTKEGGKVSLSVKIKEEPKVKEAKVKKEEKAEVKAEVKTEVKAEATTEAAEAVGGSETGSHSASPAAIPKKPASKKRPRSGSFPREKKKRVRVTKGPKSPADPGVVKKAKSMDTEKPLESPVLPPLTLLLPPLPVVPPKAFLVEEDHNSFKCDMCGKGFRKNQLLHDHIKHYHKAEGLHLTPAPTRKRKKTLSTCSTDSDMSISSKSNSAKRRRHISEVSVGSPDVAMRMSFEEESPSSAVVATEAAAPETPVVEAEEESSDEVVNCVCGFREETGTMIQCDCCQCWQHTLCLGFTDQDLASDTFLSTYICFVCKCPPGVRESAKYLYDMDWFRKGRLPRFSFVKQEGNEEREKELLATHDLVADLLSIQKVMHGLREEIALTGEKDHPELLLWHPQPPKEMRSVGVSTSEDKEPEPQSSGTTTSADTGQHAGGTEPGDCREETSHAGEAAVGEEKTGEEKNAVAAGEATAVKEGESTPVTGEGTAGEGKSTLAAGEATVEEGKSTAAAGEAAAAPGQEGGGTESQAGAGGASAEAGTPSATPQGAVTGDRGSDASEKDPAPSPKKESQSEPQTVQPTPVEIVAEKTNLTKTEGQESPATVGGGCDEAVRSQGEEGGKNEAVGQEASRNQNEVPNQRDPEKSRSEAADLSEAGKTHSESGSQGEAGKSCSEAAEQRETAAQSEDVKSQSDSAGPDGKTGQHEITGQSESGKSQSEAESTAGQPEAVQLKSDETQGAGVEEGDKAKDVGKVDAEVSSKVKTELLDTSGEQDCEGIVSSGHQDPSSDCKLAILSYVRSVQEDLSRQLDAFEQQIVALEHQEFGAEAAGSYSNIPTLKLSLYRLARDLNKVKSIASYR